MGVLHSAGRIAGAGVFGGDMTHMTEEEWHGAMGVATADTPTVYSAAFGAWDEWNPEWVVDRINSSWTGKETASFTSDEVMRAFMEGYLQGVAKKLTGGDYE